MNIQYTSNNVPFETNKTAKLACLLPIDGVHSKAQAIKAMGELEAKYINYDVKINWQKP